MADAAHHQAPPVAYPGVPGANPMAQTGTEFFLSNYRLGKTLGIGSFGKVKVAEHILTGHKVAIKILNRKKIRQMDMEDKVRREIKILRLFMHPHIIRLYEVIETAHDIYVVMEYVKSGELFDYIVEKGRLMEDEARRFFQQIVSGVEYCHRNMVVHRDLKPENLLLDSRMNVKIADFGLSNVMRDGHFLKTSCGSPNYAAPEVISGRLYAGPEVDVWSCGVILYALLCGSLPFDDENIPNLFKKIKGGIYTLPSHLSPGARDLIPRMLLVEPLKRITIPEIRQHPWFSVHLPRYLAVMHTDPVASAAALDEEVVGEVARLGFSPSFLAASVQRREQNKATVTYYLLADNRRRMPSSAYLREEMTEGQEGGAGGARAPPAPGANPAARLVVARQWRLGWSCRARPATAVAELCRALAAAGVAWKKLAPYSYKCRVALAPAPTMEGPAPSRSDSVSDGVAMEASGMMCGEEVEMEGEEESSVRPGERAPGDGEDGDGAQAMDTSIAAGGGGEGGRHVAAPRDAPTGGEREVKFEVQMYKARDGDYVLDFQRLSGDLFLFMDVCSSVLFSLRI
ncbi:SNRK1A [Auxenochlorella protothecoides x Auxenochlorella symbiontica]